MPATDRMPTAARLVAAILLAGLAWAASQQISALMPDDTDFGWFDLVNSGIAFLCGWTVIGRRMGRGWLDGIGAGLTGTVALVFWAVFAQSLYEMLVRALDRRFNGPVEAIGGMMEIAVDYARHLIDAPLIGLLIIGGIVVGLIAEAVSHRWS